VGCDTEQGEQFPPQSIPVSPGSRNPLLHLSIASSFLLQAVSKKNSKSQQ
jgi:hypothetical protein